MASFPTPGKGERHTIALEHHGPNKINPSESLAPDKSTSDTQCCCHWPEPSPIPTPQLEDCRYMGPTLIMSTLRENPCQLSKMLRDRCSVHTLQATPSPNMKEQPPQNNLTPGVTASSNPQPGMDQRPHECPSMSAMAECEATGMAPHRSSTLIARFSAFHTFGG